ncbi:MAG TPA: aspartate carbamoyltransferase catalytic subunit, partial [Anaeromyxobacteraceae bacterium]
TRTRSSFEIAAKVLSADALNWTSTGSSVSKGETLLDTARNLEAMRPDVIVVRHAAGGAPAFLARNVKCSVVSAGDGAHEHPSQGLLDCFTIRERLGSLSGRTVAIVGDISHSRVARSDLHALGKLGARVRVCGPPTMIPQGIERLGATVFHDLESSVAGADAVVMLRIQHERIGDPLIPGTREYSSYWGLNVKKASAWLKPECLILHPGPINRGVELSSDVADGPHSVILDQVENGVAVRMAILYLLAGAGATAEGTSPEKATA